MDDSVIILISLDDGGTASVKVNGEVFVSGFPDKESAVKNSAAAFRDFGISDTVDEILSGAVEVATVGKPPCYVFTTSISPTTF